LPASPNATNTPVYPQLCLEIRSHESEEWSQLGGSYLLAGMFTIAKRQHVAKGGRGRKGKRVVEEKEEVDAEEGWVKISNNPPAHVRLIS
jgi:hypothetical protein